MKNSLRKKVRTCRQTDCGMNEWFRVFKIGNPLQRLVTVSHIWSNQGREHRVRPYNLDSFRAAFTALIPVIICMCSPNRPVRLRSSHCFPFKCTRIISRWYSGRPVKLTTHLHLTPLYAFIACMDWGFIVPVLQRNTVPTNSHSLRVFTSSSYIEWRKKTRHGTHVVKHRVLGDFWATLYIIPTITE